MITKMTAKYEKQLTDYLYQHNLKKEYFVAWIPETYAGISSLNKDNFLLCIENDEIVGCIGVCIFEEQKLARLLGPVIDKEYLGEYIDALYELCLQNIPKNITQLKVAFFKENQCRNWYEQRGFDLYNAEKTMIYNLKSFTKQVVPPSVRLSFYGPQYRKGLELVHPKGVFFTLDELIDQISEYNHLLLATVQGEVVGYVYYEQTEDLKKGEISLLHVREDRRGKGYGTTLIMKAINHLINENLDQISINVRVENQKAQKLYKRLGFVEKETIYAYRKML